MVTKNEGHLINKTERQSGLLGERVEQDMVEVLNEYGAPATGDAPERGSDFPVTNFAYGIPMAGVRYYMITRER